MTDAEHAAFLRGFELAAPPGRAEINRGLGGLYPRPDRPGRRRAGSRSPRREGLDHGDGRTD